MRFWESRNEHETFVCRAIAPRLLEYATKPLALPDKKRIEQHLDRCGACRHELAEYRQALRLASEVAAAAFSRLPDGLADVAPSTGTAADRAQIAAPVHVAALCLDAGGRERGGRHCWSRLVDAALLSTPCCHTPDGQRDQSIPIIAPSPLLQNTEEPSLRIRKTIMEPMAHSITALLQKPLQRQPQLPQQQVELVQRIQKPSAKAQKTDTLPAPAASANPPGLVSPHSPALTDDLVYLNGNGERSLGLWNAPPAKARALQTELAQLLESSRVAETILLRFPCRRSRDREAGAARAALAAYKQQAAIVDARLARKVRVGVKDIAMSALCQRACRRDGHRPCNERPHRRRKRDPVLQSASSARHHAPIERTLRISMAARRAGGCVPLRIDPLRPLSTAGRRIAQSGSGRSPDRAGSSDGKVPQISRPEYHAVCATS